MTGRSAASTVAAVSDLPLLRIIDGDEHSLERRVARALAALPAGARVHRFTYWYTGRPPVHEATLSAPSASARRSRAARG